MKRILCRVAGSAMLALGLAACGGGGGGGGDSKSADSSGGSGGAGYTTVAASIAGVTPSTIKSDYYEGAQPTSYTTFNGSAKGDLSVLNGKTLYVILEDPDGLFAPNPSAFVSGSSLTLNAVNQVKKPGTYKGSLNIYACLDAGCTVRLGNVPYPIPYDVRVRSNLAFDANASTTIAATAAYSASGQTVSLKIRPPEGRPVSDLQFLYSNSYLGFQASITDNGDGSGMLNVQVPAAKVRNHYALSYLIEAAPGIPPVPPKTLNVNLDIQ